MGLVQSTFDLWYNAIDIRGQFLFHKKKDIVAEVKIKTASGNNQIKIKVYFSLITYKHLPIILSVTLIIIQ